MAMSELQLALSRLKGVKKTSNGYDATCPCHEDKHQSLSISEKNGNFLAYCHAGCSFESIIKALDLRLDKTNDTPIIMATYDYTDASGNLLYQVVRYHPKAFKQRRPDGEGDWIWDLKGIIPTLYHMTALLPAIRVGEIVFIVEGEKDANNLRKIGQAATTISGGVSTKWHPSLIPLFEGAKVVIIPDNDEAGRKYALYVASLLYGWCSSLKIISLPCKDVSDYLRKDSVSILDGVKVEDSWFNPIDKLLQIVDNTKEYIPQGAVTREECQSCRGLNRYLWNELKQRKPRRQPKFD